MVSSMPSQVSHSLPETLAAEIAMEKPSWKIVKQSREPVGIKVHEYCTLAIKLLTYHQLCPHMTNETRQNHNLYPPKILPWVSSISLSSIHSPFTFHSAAPGEDPAFDV
jgi:hypothetical protein